MVNKDVYLSTLERTRSERVRYLREVRIGARCMKHLAIIRQSADQGSTFMQRAHTPADTWNVATVSSRHVDAFHQYPIAQQQRSEMKSTPESPSLLRRDDRAYFGPVR